MELKDFLSKNYRIIIMIFLVLLVILSNLFVYRFAFDAIVVFLIILAIIFKKEKEFFKEWSMPIALFYLYEFIRGKAYVIAEFLNRPLLTDVLIKWESKLFSINGEIPTVFLQYNLSNASTGAFTPNWYDYILFFFYMSFFWFWLGIGFWIWKKRREVFKKYIYGLIAFSMISAVVYIFFPSAPPWYAAKIGLLPSLDRLMLIYDYFSARYVSLVSTYGNNDFAAFPSLHAAWPFYASIFAIGTFGKKVLPLLLVPLVIVFATWYGAEHYIVDSLFGFLLAGGVYLVVNRGFRVEGSNENTI